MVPIRFCWMPYPPFVGVLNLPMMGVPLVRNGGQMAAQLPVQALVVAFCVSFMNTYRVMPLLSTR